MRIFGRPYGDYLRFQWAPITAALAVGGLRLGASLAGVPNTTTRWLSVTAVGLVALVYYGIAVHLRGFGSYRQLLVLIFNQSAAANVVIVLGLAISIATGTDNIFSAPEYSPGGHGRTWGHVAGHLIAVVVASLVLWVPGSLILWITRKVAPGPAA
jgi:hypothetical protein